MEESSAPLPDFLLTCSKEILGLVKNHDWAATTLGAVSSWSPALRSVLQLTMDSKFPMLIAWGPELRILYNDAYIPILGNKHPIAFGSSIPLTWPEAWAALEPMISRALAGESSYFENMPFKLDRWGKFEEAWFTFSYSPIRELNGDVHGVLCTAIETTAFVLHETSREKETARLHALFEQAPGIMAVFREPDHRYEITNLAYREFVGDREFLSRPVRDVLPQAEGSGFFELLDQVYSSGEAYRAQRAPFHRQRADGSLEERYFDFVLQPVENVTGRVSGIFLQGSDITESVRAQKAVVESERHMRQLANSIPQLAWMANADGWIHWYNDRWYDYTGTTIEQMAGWGWQSVHDPEKLPEVMHEWKNAIATGQRFQMTFPLKGRDGNFRPFFTMVAPFRNEDGQIVQWFGTNTDVTPLEEIQHELRLSNRRKDEFLAMLAHELRNPLAPISHLVIHNLKASPFHEGS